MANMVAVEKKNGNWIVYVDFTYLHKAFPKDLFPFPHIDPLVNVTKARQIIIFMDSSFEF